MERKKRVSQTPTKESKFVLSEAKSTKKQSKGTVTPDCPDVTETRRYQTTSFIIQAKNLFSGTLCSKKHRI